MPRSRPASAAPAFETQKKVSDQADQAIVADLMGRGIARELAERASLATGNSDTAQAFRWTIDHFAGELQKVENGDIASSRPTSQQATRMLSRENTPVQRLQLRSQGKPASAAGRNSNFSIQKDSIARGGPSPTIYIRDEVEQWKQDGKPVTPLSRKSSTLQPDVMVERLPPTKEVIKARAAAVKPPLPPLYQKILAAKIHRADEFLKQKDYLGPNPAWNSKWRMDLARKQAEIEKRIRRPATAPRQQETEDIKAIKKELQDLKDEVRSGILGIGSKPHTVPAHGPGRRRPGMYYAGRAILYEHVD